MPRRARIGGELPPLPLCEIREICGSFCLDRYLWTLERVERTLERVERTLERVERTLERVERTRERVERSPLQPEPWRSIIHEALNRPLVRQ